MKKKKKVMAGLISATILAANMASLGVNASEAYDYNQAPTMLPGQSINMTSRTSPNFYGYYETPSMIAGEPCKTPTVSITGSSNRISSGDFGVWWFEGGVGLSTNFVRSTSRTVNIELYEEDKSDNTAILTRSQTGHFTVGNDGVYTVSHFTGGDALNTGVVEYDSTAEVYMMLTVSTEPGDKSVSIPAVLMVYGYWID
ncbi:MAG: hypothetical protein K2O52_06075 [Oscillospiraceae bacterium]|nr:hypothetical protein [Oscillospiraceae bacterium]MDE7094459.1 hypothetical protein [Oscillospiraceae bacterium]